MQNSIIIATIVIVVVIVAGAYFFFGMNRAALSSGGSGDNQQTTSTAGQSGGNQAFTVKVSYNAAVGNYMTNGTGWTMYIYTKDTPNSGKSTCYSTCATYWPPVSWNPNLNLNNGINGTAFGKITRTDNTTQLTYDGYPLYYYAADKQAGDISGQNVDGTWFVVTVPLLNTHG